MLLWGISREGAFSPLSIIRSCSSSGSCTELRRDPQGLVNCEQHAAECVSIPCHPAMTDSEIDRVMDVVKV